jgi:hypothetical protein
MADATPPEPLRQLDQHDYSARIVRQKIWKRMNLDNEHFMGAVVGREGSGKSHSALSIARTVDPSFTADDVFFDPQDLLEAFDSDDYGAGNVIILDEAGVGLGNRSWYDKEQILLNQTLQTVRDDNMGVFFTLPRLEELDSQTIGRLHAFIEMLETHPDEGWAISKWKNISLSRDGRGDEWKKYTVLRVNGVKKRITRFGVSAPPADLVERYEQRKESFKDELKEEAIAAYDDDGDGDSTSPKDIAQEIANHGIEEYVSQNTSTKEAYINKDLIRVEYDISHSDASAVKKLLEKSFTSEQIADALRTHTQTP